MIRLLALLVAAGSCAACSQPEDYGDVGRCPCKGYVACAYNSGQAPLGSLDAKFGANGSCWVTTSSADMCCSSCRTSAMSFETSGVAADAGCPIPWAQTAGG